MPNRAKIFLAAVMMIAAAISVYAIGTRVPAESREFVVLLAMAIVASRLKLTLPGFESHMSMNLPFMLLAIAELSMPEAIAVGAASTLAQTVLRPGQTLKQAQNIFNVCNVVNAVAIASIASGRAMHTPAFNRPFLIAAAALAFFIAETVPVAAIISMTSTSRFLEGWSEIALMTFPYFVLSAGLACIVAMGFQAVRWSAGVATLAVMLVVYRCFKFYFLNVRAMVSIGSPVHSAVGAD